MLSVATAAWCAFRQRRTARDEQDQPIRDEDGRPELEWV